MDAATGERWIAYLAGDSRVLPGGKKAKGLAGKTISNRHGLLSSSFNRAVSNGLLVRNPLRGLHIPETPRLDMVFLTSAEWWLLHDCLMAHWRPLCLTLVGTGLRFGEATALRCADIDIDGQRIRVTRAWKEDENGHRFIGPPKNKASLRSVGFDAQLAPILKKVTDDRPRLVGCGPVGGSVQSPPR